VDRRLAAAARMGFRRAVVPAGSFAVGATLPAPDLAIIEVPDVVTALTAVLPGRRISGVPSPGIRRVSGSSYDSLSGDGAARNRLHPTAQPKEADASSAR
jgi:hypothetical protein